MSSFKTIYGSTIKRTNHLRAYGIGLVWVTIMVQKPELISRWESEP